MSEWHEISDCSALFPRGGQISLSSVLDSILQYRQHALILEQTGETDIF